DHQRFPALGHRHVRVEHQGARDLQQPRGAFGPIDVAPEPEAMISHPRNHDAAFFCTQVSFDPPPWLELTTYDPSTSATRVNPPGSTQDPDGRVSTKGRRSTRRGASRSFAGSQVGQVDSSTRCWAM